MHVKLLSVLFLPFNKVIEVCFKMRQKCAFVKGGGAMGGLLYKQKTVIRAICNANDFFFFLLYSNPRGLYWGFTLRFLCCTLTSGMSSDLYDPFPQKTDATDSGVVQFKSFNFVGSWNNVISQAVIMVVITVGALFL